MAIAEAAAEVCDLIWIVDTTDPETSSMSRLLRRIGDMVDVTGMSLEEAATAISDSRPDGILALADDMLVWTAQIATLLELRFVTPEVARRLTDKYAQRVALQRGGVPVPGFWQVPEENDDDSWSALAQAASFPAVLKPRSGEGSRDTVRVDSFMELRSKVAETPSASGSVRAELVLEEYLRDRPQAVGHHFADYVSVESVVSAGQISHVAITGRFPPAEPFRETGFFIPCAFDNDQCRAIAEVATAAVQAIGVSLGLLHTEIKLTPTGPRVIELNGRIGGGVPEMLADATGVELLPIALRVALGELITFDSVPRCDRIGYLLYVQAPLHMTTIRSVDGIDQLRAHAGVQEVTLNRGPGRAVHWRSGNHGHVFSVRGSVADYDALRSIERYANTEVRIHGD
ncbi:MAG TPA: ATP-grasp domain-containing protein [Solirubrobacteraceae bacterium]